MATLRRAAMAEVDAAVASGLQLSRRDLIQHPDDPGCLPEGAEFEGDLEPGEQLWLQEQDQQLEDEDAAGLLQMDQKGPKRLIPAEPGDESAALAEAEIAARSWKLFGGFVPQLLKLESQRRSSMPRNI